MNGPTGSVEDGALAKSRPKTTAAPLGAGTRSERGRALAQPAVVGRPARGGDPRGSGPPGLGGRQGDGDIAYVPAPGCRCGDHPNSGPRRARAQRRREVLSGPAPNCGPIATASLWARRRIRRQGGSAGGRGDARALSDLPGCRRTPRSASPVGAALRTARRWYGPLVPGTGAPWGIHGISRAHPWESTVVTGETSCQDEEATEGQASSARRVSSSASKRGGEASVASTMRASVASSYPSP
ncbi:hypothetical protein SAMN05428944_0861 [Streptomyces sp. 1222.5]|nr:hypothetical protein BX260_7232 [Streptomyces sp. 5112.2]SEB67230.1 hypothetical protein SAMN05428944_0861 [Streptomyces sp. 1222.5]